MTVHVTQGHEKGIGLEVFFKSILELDQSEVQKIRLYVCQKTLEKHLKNLKINFSVSHNVCEFYHKQVTCHFFENEEYQSTTAMNLALENISVSDVLVTLPTSKDQLYFEGNQVSGHTEFFRKKYQDNSISMIFKYEDTNLLLLTDHIPLSKVEDTITEELIESKVGITLTSYEKYFNNLDNIIFAGINPHAGESGILGTSDKVIESSINKLNKQSKKNFIGPLSGDTLIHKKSDKTLLVYTYHDQGLSAFKAMHGFNGINVTFGLPFVRLSVDHGTAFDLYGKGNANHLGQLYVLKTALELNS